MKPGDTVWALVDVEGSGEPKLVECTYRGRGEQPGCVPRYALTAQVGTMLFEVAKVWERREDAEWYDGFS